jgi:hypothetical protein
MEFPLAGDLIGVTVTVCKCLPVCLSVRVSDPRCSSGEEEKEEEVVGEREKG